MPKSETNVSNVIAKEQSTDEKSKHSLLDDSGKPNSEKPSEGKNTEVKPKRPQAVLFLYPETSLRLKTQFPEEYPELLKVLDKDAELNTPIVKSSEFSNSIEKFFSGRQKKEANEVSFADAQLLLFPLKTMRGVFTWGTSIPLLQSFDAKLKQTTVAPRWPIVGLDEEATLSGPHNACVVKEHCALEEYNFPVKVEKRVQGISRWLAANAVPQGAEFQWWRAKLARDLLILPHNIFSSLVRQNLGPYALEQDYIEEVIPKESLFYSVLGASLAESQLELPITSIGKSLEQGHGLCRLNLVCKANNKVKRNRPKSKNAQKNPTPQGNSQTKDASQNLENQNTETAGKQANE